MAKQYVFVRMRKEDFDKIVQTKKIPMEQDMQRIVGKKIKIKTTQLFNIAANSVWDLGDNFQHRIIKAVRVKRGDLKI